LAEKYNRLARLTKCIVFLGTPHRGSYQAGWDLVVKNLAELAFQDVNSPLVRALAINSEMLDKIQADLLKFVQDQNLKVRSFQEGRDVSGVGGFSGKVIMFRLQTI
jgi:hypothetical protein